MHKKVHEVAGVYNNKNTNTLVSTKLLKSEEKEQLLDHYEVHRRKTDQLTDVDENGSTDFDDDKNKELMCPICNTAQAARYYFQPHVIFKHKPKDHYAERNPHGRSRDFIYVTCNVFTTKTSKDLLAHFSKEHVKEGYYCDECDKNFTSNTWFEDHKIFYVEGSNKEKFKCSTCSSTFPNRYTMNQHMQEIHKKFKCFPCHITFPYKKNLDVHNQNFHSMEGDNKFLCNECGKVFTSQGLLRTHTETHGEGKHICSVCGKLFKKRSGLTLHARIHTGEKPYKRPNIQSRYNQKEPEILKFKVVHTTKLAKTNKATEPDNIPAKLLKSEESDQFLIITKYINERQIN
ncbi:zinc finger protein 250-like [Diabrotica virgifera virgifera]|uniref:C2H2-type domain-containing protein n=1 Tax=Diabrotica virgifera virgifera TaxID=50390 RepID=A0ABM5L356_DIAVI|nr:zinc finger protein 250-like [Diabrotica virgifera virgifera]